MVSSTEPKCLSCFVLWLMHLDFWSFDKILNIVYHVGEFHASYILLRGELSYE